MLNKFKGKYLEGIQYLIAAACYLAVIYTTLTYGRAIINSDVSLVDRFYKAVVETKSIYPTSWNAVNGEVYAFTRLPISVLVLAFVKDKALAIVISNCILFTIAVAGVIWLTTKFFGNKSWLICVPLLCVYIFGDNARNMIFLHGAYCPGVLVYTFVFGLFWFDVLDENKSKARTALYSFLLFLMILGGKRHVAEYLLPTIAVFVFYIVFMKKNIENRTTIIKMSALKLFIPSALGYALYKYVCSTHNMNFGGNSNPSLELGIDHLVTNIKIAVSNIYENFGYSSDRTIVYKIVAITVGTLIWIVIPVLQAFEYKKLNEKEQIFFLTALVHNVELFLVIIVCDMLQARYTLSTIFMCLMVSGNYIYKKLAQLEFKKLRVAIVCLFALVSLGLCRDLVRHSIGWNDKMNAQKQIAEELVAHDIAKGYASFWNGYPVEVYSNGKITFGGVDISEASLMKQYSNCDNSCYEYMEGKSCVMLSEKECDDLRNVLGDGFIHQIIGDPSEVFEIVNPLFQELYGTNKFIVFVFDKDVCDRLTDGLKDGVLSPRELFFNMMGTRTDDMIELMPGGIIHGPYKKIASGNYKVVYKGEGLGECGVSITSESSQESIEYSIESQNQDEIILNVEIKNYIEDIQFYLTNDGTENCKFYEIEIE